MGYLEKLRSKTVKALLKAPPVYAFGRARASKNVADDLPTSGDAMQILESAWPRPARCRLPEERDWPKIPEVEGTIIVPCYNVAEYVGECIDSVLGQRTKRSFEVIAVDDGSTDDTGALLDQMAARDVRLRVIHQKNRGFSGARNTGISLARGGGVALCRLRRFARA